MSDLIKELEKLIFEEQGGNSHNIELLKHFGRHYENTNSAVIADFLNVKDTKGENIFLKPFLEMIKPDFDCSNFKNSQAYLEEPAVVTINDKEWGGRIDIFVKLSEDTCIIIENKINAEDQPYQLQRYITYLDSSKSKPINEYHKQYEKVYVVYLSLEGGNPTIYEDEGNKNNYSISRELFNEISEKKRFTAISYKDILEWMNSFKIDKNNEILYSAWVQYKYSLRILAWQKIVNDKLICLSKSEEYLNNDFTDFLNELNTSNITPVKGAIRALQIKRLLGSEWEFAIKAEENKFEPHIFEDIIKYYIPIHIYLVNKYKGLALMIFGDLSDQIQLQDLSSGFMRRQEYFNENFTINHVVDFVNII